MNVLLAQGIGDSAWALLKIKALAERERADGIDLKVACWNKDHVEGRALDFLRRFSFVRSAEMYQMPRLENQQAPLLLPGDQADARGHYRYFRDGPVDRSFWNGALADIDFVMIPNAALEKGIRLEDWMCGLETDWGFMRDYDSADDEDLAMDALAAVDVQDGWSSRQKAYVVLFMGCHASNSIAGHNKDALWTPDDWIKLGRELHVKMGAKLLVVGARYDEAYFTQHIAPRVVGLDWWVSAIGIWPIGVTLEVIRRARMMISYQSGLGILAHYMNVPTACWWRPKGNSISPGSYVSPDEEMATAWTYPDWREAKRYIPLIYGRESVQDIVKKIEELGW